MYGGVPLPVFYAENGEPIITPETTEHVAQILKNMVQMYGLNGMQKTYYQKGSLIQILQMVSLQKS